MICVLVNFGDQTLHQMPYFLPFVKLQRLLSMKSKTGELGVTSSGEQIHGQFNFKSCSHTLEISLIQHPLYSLLSNQISSLFSTSSIPGMLVAVPLQVSPDNIPFPFISAVYYNIERHKIYVSRFKNVCNSNFIADTSQKNMHFECDYIMFADQIVQTVVSIHW